MEMDIIRKIDRNVGIPLCYLLGFFNGKAKKDTKVKKILMIKFSGFGNIVLALPSIRAVKKKYPNSKIVFLTHTINKSIIEKDPVVDKIITFDVNDMKETLKDIFKLISKLRKERFDVVLDFEQFSRFSSLISYLSGAKTKVGFKTDKQGRHYLYNIQVLYNDEQHTSKTFSDIVNAMNAEVDYKDTKIYITKEDKLKVSKFFEDNSIKKNDLLIGIHPGCGINNPKRKWPKEKFAKLADFLVEDYNAKIFFTGSNSEKELIKEIQKMMKNKSIDTSGVFNLRELPEVISRCRLFFSNDTGPLHLASAMKVPVGCFFGPNTPKLYGPLGDNNLIFYKEMDCSPCTTNFNEKKTNCSHFNCMKTIELDEVINKIKESKLLEK
ncbi:MAG: lipopolysaccharide heptosyltransferase II [Nanoarchaeota archaeon]|nr:lipopolysaccharide heptosyltransferase II [Nanoarchaeota archaeon]